MESKGQTACKKWHEAKRTEKNDISDGIEKVYSWICNTIEENAKNKNFMNPVRIHHESGSKNLIFEGKKLSHPDYYINGLLEKASVTTIFESLVEKFSDDKTFIVDYKIKRTLFGVKNILTLTIL